MRLGYLGTLTLPVVVGDLKFPRLRAKLPSITRVKHVNASSKCSKIPKLLNNGWKGNLGATEGRRQGWGCS